MTSLIRIVFGLCILLVFGAPAAAGCSLIKVTEMPLIRLGNHYAVLAKVDDEMSAMIVDTGAPDTFLSSDFVDNLGMRRDVSPGNLRPIFGPGQTRIKVFPNAVAGVFALGDLVFHDRSLPVGKMDLGKGSEDEAIGIIGDDILSQYDVEFDFPGNKLTFYRATECYDSFIPWKGTYSTIPIDRIGSRVIVDVTLNDERDQALVDTGNPTSFVTRKLLRRWHVTEDQLSKPVGKMGSPLNGGSSVDVQLYTFNTVKIGYETFPPMYMAIADMDLPYSTINLGLSFLASNKVWISYPRKWMFVAKQGATTLAYPVQKMTQADSKTPAAKLAAAEGHP